MSRPDASRACALAALLALLALTGCGSPTSNNVAPDAPADDAATDAVTDAAADVGPADVASVDVADAAPLTVQCAGDDGPYLVVTQTTGGGPATTLLRLPLRFSGAVTGLRLRTVSQRAGGTAEVRAWPLASLQAPTGFAGSVTPPPGDTAAHLRWTATAPSSAAETGACARDPWERSAGSLHVEGNTNEGGAFAVDCALSLAMGGRTAEPLRLACARGVAGWVTNQFGQSGIMPVTMPVVAVLASAPVHTHDVGSSPVSAFVVTGATIKAHVDPSFRPPGVMCPTTGPANWDLSGGRSVLWRGRSSDEVWSGPVAPSTQEDANWLYQQNGATVPDGFCVTSNPVDPSRACPPPVSQMVLRGTSSAGPWEWEGDLFNCLVFH